MRGGNKYTHTYIHTLAAPNRSHFTIYCGHFWRQNDRSLKTWALGVCVHVLSLNIALLFMRSLVDLSFIFLIYKIGMIVLTLKCFCNP